MGRGIARLAIGCSLGVGAWLGSPLPSDALILQTTNAGDVATFSAGMNVEHFEPGLDAAALGSYDPNQPIDPSTLFSSRDGTTSPTFHSGGASPGDPVGNPGQPICIVSPSAGISGDLVSSPNVAAPIDLGSQLPWNFGFMEVIFFPGNVERLGFWITHGSVRLDLRDRQGNNLTTGEVTVTGNEGEFIGISRGASDIAVAALTLSGGGDAFTIDDFVYADSVPEPAGAVLLAVGALALGGARAARGRRAGGPGPGAAGLPAVPSWESTLAGGASKMTRMKPLAALLVLAAGVALAIPGRAQGEKLTDIEGIGPSYAAKLEAAGVATPEQLLEVAGPRTGRRHLAEKTGISGEQLLRFVNRADLSRVQGVGTQYSDLLEAAGVDTTRELARRNPDKLLEALTKANAEKKRVRQLPTRAQVARWIEAAKALPPAVEY
jgi:predicted flap endonuclease-1-like 5' DNA nuclease